MTPSSTLVSAFKSGVVTGKDEKPIPVENSQAPFYREAALNDARMHSVQKLARRLYIAMDGQISVEETHDNDAEKISASLNSNPAARILITTIPGDARLYIETDVLGTTGSLSLYDEKLTLATFARWVGRVCPEKQKAGVDALNRFQNTRQPDQKAEPVETGKIIYLG